MRKPIFVCLFFSYLSRENEKLLKSRTVSQLIMRVHEPKVAYKLVQFCWKNPREYLDALVYNQFYISIKTRDL